ncbi:MAG: selenide,water dikinase, partial [Pseudohongiellaceae bacterium]
KAYLNCLLDPQTNGGLLVSVAADVGRQLVATGHGVKIGEVSRTATAANIILFD